MKNVYIECLKKYNEGKKWSVPKKGTKEYEEVMAMVKLAKGK